MKENWNNVRRLANWKKGDYIIFTNNYSCVAVAQVDGEASITPDPIFKRKEFESRVPLKLCSDYRIKKNGSLLDIWNLLEDRRSLRKPWPHKNRKFWNMRLIEGMAADYIFKRLCIKNYEPKNEDEDAGEDVIAEHAYESQKLINEFWESTGLSHEDKGFCRHNLYYLKDTVTDRLLAFMILGVFLDQVVYTHFRSNFNHHSGFRHSESVYDRFSKAFSFPKYFSCSASGSIGSMVPAISLLELLECVDQDGFYSEIDKLSRVLLSDVYTWFRVNIGPHPQFILHNYLLAEIIIEMGGCSKEVNIARTENQISCLLKAAAKSANFNDA